MRDASERGGILAAEPSAALPAASGADASRSGRLDAPLLAVLALTAVLRFAWIALASLDPGEGDYFDMVFYHLSAHQLLAGNGYTRIDGTPTAIWPPVYPLLLAGVYAISDGSLWAGRLANPCFAVITAYATYCIGRRSAGRRCGLLAAGLFAVCPDDIFYSHFVMSEVAYGAVFTGAAAYALRLEAQREAPRSARWLALGAWTGLATLTRGAALAWWLLPLASGALRGIGLRGLAWRGGLLALGVALVLAPWTLRNAIALQAFVPIATSGGRTLAHAHSPYQQGGASLQGLLHWKRIADRLEHLPQPQREVETDRLLTRLALRYLVEHPAHELRILPARLRSFFGSGHVGLEIGRAPAPGGVQPFLGPRWHALLAGSADVYLYGLLLLALPGIWALRPLRDSAPFLLLGTLVYYTALHTLIFPDDPRYHLPLLPFLCVLAAAALRWSRRCMGRRAPA